MTSKALSYTAVATALVMAIIATILNNYFSVFTSSSSYVPPPPPVQGRNKTALFIVLPHHGLSNVHLATADALLERHPADVTRVAFASFPALEPKVRRIAEWRQQGIEFHAVRSARPYEEQITLALALGDDGGSSELLVARPGLPGLARLLRDLPVYLSPWPVAEYVAIYRELRGVIARVDPAVVVLDTTFAPAVDATRDARRLHAFVSPNTLLDNFAGRQPWLGMLWKYPLTGSGYPFPLPWHLVPSNMYLAMRFIAGVMRTPELRAKQQGLRAHGVENPIDFFHLQRDDVPWITQTQRGAAVPVDFVPRNVSAVGPITMAVAPAAAQDPQLVAWLRRGPTVLVNLGSAFRYSEARARTMAAALARVLDGASAARPGLQVLWKLARGGNYSDDDFAAPLRRHVDAGRLRIESWLNVDPVAVLETGHVALLVHHGGANLYHEAVAAGVPHVILPLWVDLYNYASLVESLRIGVWACPETSPYWTPECIGAAILRALDDGDARRNAARLGEEARGTGEGGRYAAARIVAELAGTGY